VRTTYRRAEKDAGLDDLEPDEKIKIYDKGVKVTTVEGKYNLPSITVRETCGHPELEQTEALKLIAEEFVKYVENGGTVGKRWCCRSECCQDAGSVQ